MQLALLAFTEIPKQKDRREFGHSLAQYFSNRHQPRAELLGGDEARRVLAEAAPGNRRLFERYMPDLDPGALGYLPDGG
jgi:hypothetical protein